MAYVYRHIRLDKNVPFYIGIGSQDNYTRAYTKANRNRYWHNIANIAGYEVEILIDEINWEMAQQKEIEFIKLYGRHSIGGTLCNLTDGGGGSVGLITSNEAKEKQRAAKLGRSNHAARGLKRSEESKKNISDSHLGQKAWNKGIPQSEEQKRKQSNSMKGKYVGEKHPMYGKTHSDELKERWRITRKGVSPPNKGKKLAGKALDNVRAVQIPRRKPVLQFDLLGNFIYEHESLSAAAKQTGFSKGALGSVCTGRYKQNKGFVFKYK